MPDLNERGDNDGFGARRRRARRTAAALFTVAALVFILFVLSRFQAA